MFEYSEYLQIYDSLHAYHDINHIPVTKYCLLKSLDLEIHTLITKKGRGIDIDISTSSMHSWNMFRIMSRQNGQFYIGDI